MGIIEKRKQIKKNRIIQVIREQEDVSRFVLKKATKYSMTTILNSVTALLEEGLITEEESKSKNVGRTPVILKINRKGRYFIGVEFNAERLKVCLVDFGIELVESKTYIVPPHATVEQILGLIKDGIRDMLSGLKSNVKVEGIGIGIPGYVNREDGVALEYSYFDQWKDVPVREIVEEAFGITVHIDNNINALAYHYRYEHKEKKNFVIVSMQYGVRLGIVLGGEIFIGNHGNAGEIGHTKVIDGHRRCSCGKVGCLDSEISYLAIEDKVSELIKEGRLKEVERQMAASDGRFRMAMLGEALVVDDPDSGQLLKNITGHLGRKLATVISVIDIEDIIILNICDLNNRLFAEQVYETIKDNSVASIVDNVSVGCEVVDPYAAAKGAAIMMLEENYGLVKEVQ